MTATHDIALVRTCGACPEQYEAFIGDEAVGYLRLRHGLFTVHYPDPGGALVYEATPLGDGAFTDDEREIFLHAAKLAIIKHRDMNTDPGTPVHPLYRALVAEHAMEAVRRQEAATKAELIAVVRARLTDSGLRDRLDDTDYDIMAAAAVEALADYYREALNGKKVAPR
jgi:hypothetical protein